MPHRTRPRLLALAAVPAVLAPLLLAGPAAAEDRPAAGDTVVGELVQAFADPEHADAGPGHPGSADAGHAEDGLLSWIDVDGGDAVRVPTEDVAGIEAGATVEVTVGGEVRDEAAAEQGLAPASDVVDVEVLAPAEPAAAAAPATNRVTVVMVQPGGVPRDGTTLAQVVATVDGPVRQFWEEQSDGAITVAVTGQHDWRSTAATCRHPADLWGEVAQGIGWTGGPGEHLMLYVPRNTANCSYGLGTIGSGIGHGGRLYVQDPVTSVIAHELGHNFGLGHASAHQCDAGPETGPCRTVSYWDLYDVMGVSWGPVGSLNPPHSARLGLLTSSAQATVPSTGPGGTYTLVATGSRTGTRALVLLAGSTRYWLEYRAAVGRDGWLSDPRVGRGLEAGVLVRIDGPGPTSDTSLLLDGTPSAQAQWGQDQQSVLPVGGQLWLGSGLTVSVTQTSSTEATVRVDTTSTAPHGPVLYPGQERSAGQDLRSANGRYRAVVQDDGNLVVYAPDGRVLWHSATRGDPGGRMALQSDGNLVLYSSAGRALWHSDTWGTPGSRLVLQDDGNLVLYAGPGAPIWFSGWDRGPGAPMDVLLPRQQLTAGQRLTSANGAYSAVLQSDGNFVLYASDRRVLWHSRTSTVPGGRLSSQADGNVVVRAPSRQVAWHAGTWGNPGTRLVLQSDGNLVLYASTGRALWSSSHGRTY